MRCIFCKSTDTSVVDSRLVDDNRIKRRRECRVCKKRFNTYEEVEFQPITVIKKDNSTAPFDRKKIYNGITRALVKRKYNANDIRNLVADIEIEIREKYSKGIRSTEIGELILKHLLDIDEVAYVRFASVYNKFENLDSFIEIINKIKKDRGRKWKERIE